MMGIFIEGLVLGMLLAVSLGPIFIALTQTSLEKGIKPGLTVGSGIWVSDFIIVYLVYKFINTIKSTIESDFFMFCIAFLTLRSRCRAQMCYFSCLFTRHI